MTTTDDATAEATHDNTADEAPQKKRHGFHKPETAEEACTRMSFSYQHQFEGSVPPLKSSEMLANYSPADIILIDCRTRPERAISMIQGAIALDALNVASLSTDDDKKDKTVVTYCSVGYRSGLEAEHLKDILGKNREVFNLDGILAYTHALAASKQDAPPLVNPDTQEVTTKVHCFSKQWNVASDKYETTQFSTAESLYRMGQVASHSAVRKTQHAAHKLTCKE